MPVSLSVIATKDSAGTAVAGGLQAQDKSGAGTGPFTLGHVLIDGLAGTLMAAVTAGNALKVDGSAVTQPVSMASTTITGTVAATQSGTWTVQPGNTANTTAWKVDGSAVTQPVSLATLPVTNAGTFAVQATLAAETTKVLGVTRTVGNVGGVLDAIGQNVAAPANALQIGGQFNTTPTTITTGNFSPLQLDNAGNLLVNIKTGASSGAVAQGSTTSGQTGSLIQGAVTTSAPSYTTAQTSPLSLDTAGNLRVNVVAGGAGGGIVTQATGTNLHTVVDSGTLTANMGTVTADPFGANADAASATGSISAKLRFIAATGIPITGTVTVGSHAVTNAGTFAVQSATTLAAETTKVIGTVNIAAAQSLTANMGTVTADPFGANADAASATGSISAKLRFIAATGIPITGTVTVGSHAVTNAGTFATQATLAAETTKVIGTVNLSAAQTLATVTNLATINSVAPAFGSGANGATVLRTALATDSPGIITVGTAGTASSQVVTMQGIASMTPILATATAAASEVHVGEVGGKTAVKILAMSTDTSAYASGDLIADTQQLDAAFRVSNGTGILNTLTIIDQDAQGAALYVMFHYTSTTMGTENSAPSISDANLAAGLQGMVAVATTDYVTVSGAKVACIKNVGLPLKAVSGTDDLYVSILNSTGTPTYTATGLNLALGILQD